MKPSNIITSIGVVVGVIAILIATVILIGPATSSQNTELTQMLMTIKADQERLLTQNEELLAFKKSLTEAICPKVEPVVQDAIVQPEANDIAGGAGTDAVEPEFMGPPAPAESNQQPHVHE